MRLVKYGVRVIKHTNTSSRVTTRHDKSTSVPPIAPSSRLARHVPSSRPGGLRLVRAAVPHPPVGSPGSSGSRLRRRASALLLRRPARLSASVDQRAAAAAAAVRSSSSRAPLPPEPQASRTVHAPRGGTRTHAEEGNGRLEIYAFSSFPPMVTSAARPETCGIIRAKCAAARSCVCCWRCAPR